MQLCGLKMDDIKRPSYYVVGFSLLDERFADPCQLQCLSATLEVYATVAGFKLSFKCVEGRTLGTTFDILISSPRLTIESSKK